MIGTTKLTIPMHTYCGEQHRANIPKKSPRGVAGKQMKINITKEQVELSVQTRKVEKSTIF